ncbi:TPA: hypothetical protein ACH3X1_016481 [Trebouxia sp. C0004]
MPKILKKQTAQIGIQTVTTISAADVVSTACVTAAVEAAGAVAVIDVAVHTRDRHWL